MKFYRSTWLFIVIILTCIITGSKGVPRDITDFFPSAKGNLTTITWDHAVNSQKLLQSALKSDIMMIEADVLLGTLTTSSSTKDLIPIMGHPPATTSDLSLAEFIEKVIEFNRNSEDTEKRKGIKLDFKSIEAFEGSLAILSRNYLKMNFPLWLNADILPGPLDAPAKPVDPNRFLPLCKRYDNATLSIGWTTKNVNNGKVKYTLEQVEDMFDVIRHHAISQPITVPIRSGFAAESFAELKELLFVLPPGSTLTFWHAKDDYVDTKVLGKIVNSLGVARVFIDLPPEIYDELNLDE